jgi:hypothetical protein
VNRTADDAHAATGDKRGYSWPQFTDGNTIALRHGSRSDRFVHPLAAAFRDVLLADRPDLASYPEAVAAWATAEARCELLRVHHAKAGFVGADGTVRNSHDILMFESQAMKLRQVLGLDPMSDAALAKSRADAVLTQLDLESIRQRGREALADANSRPSRRPSWMRRSSSDGRVGAAVRAPH